MARKGAGGKDGYFFNQLYELGGSGDEKANATTIGTMRGCKDPEKQVYQYRQLAVLKKTNKQT